MPWITEAEDEPKGSETRRVTVTLGTGYFVFRNLKIYDKTGVVRDIFGKGEDVYFNCDIGNTGVSLDAVLFKIIDEDTGETLLSSGFTIHPGDYVEYELTKIGAMPDHDWHLRFEVTP